MLHTLLAMVMSINSFLVFLFILFTPFYCFIFQFYLNKDFTHNCSPFLLNRYPWTQTVVRTEVTIGTTVTMVTVSCRYRARTEMLSLIDHIPKIFSSKKVLYQWELPKIFSSKKVLYHWESVSSKDSLKKGSLCPLSWVWSFILSFFILEISPKSRAFCPLVSSCFLCKHKWTLMNWISLLNKVLRNKIYTQGSRIWLKEAIRMKIKSRISSLSLSPVCIRKTRSWNENENVWWKNDHIHELLASSYTTMIKT